MIEWLVGVPVGIAIGWILRTPRRPKTAMLCRISDGPEMGKFVAICKDGHIIELEPSLTEWSQSRTGREQ